MLEVVFGRRIYIGTSAWSQIKLTGHISAMAQEIERKFLVANHDWKDSVIRSIRIRDGLIANNKGNKARVRIANDVATIALKSRRSGLARTEFEYVIPYSDAEEMLRIMCEGNVLDKARHFVSHAGNTWQVDVYEGLLDGIVLAEIELTDADQKIDTSRLDRGRGDSRSKVQKNQYGLGGSCGQPSFPG